MWEWGCKITDSVLLVLQLHVLRLELKVNILTKKKKETCGFYTQPFLTHETSFTVSKFQFLYMM